MDKNNTFQTSVAFQFSQLPQPESEAISSSSGHFEFDSSREFLNAQFPYSSQEQSQSEDQGMDSWTPQFQSQQISSQHTVMRPAESQSIGRITCPDSHIHPPLRRTHRVKTFCDRCPAKIRQEDTWYCEDCDYDICQKCYRGKVSDLNKRL